jgi:hypothetical protein
MEGPEAARASTLRLRVLKAAGVSAAASSGRRDRVASRTAEAMLRVFFVAVWVSIAGRWIDVAAGCAAAWLGGRRLHGRLVRGAVPSAARRPAVPLAVVWAGTGRHRSGKVWARVD